MKIWSTAWLKPIMRRKLKQKEIKEHINKVNMKKIIKKLNRIETKIDIKRNNMIKKRSKSHKKISNNLKKLLDHSSTKEKSIPSIKPTQGFLPNSLPIKRVILTILILFKRVKILTTLSHRGNLNLSQLMQS